MILYFSGSSRPYILYAVHQCNWFSRDLRKSHEIGVKHIARYLKETKIKGILVVSDRNNLRIDLYTDFEASIGDCAIDARSRIYCIVPKESKN